MLLRLILFIFLFGLNTNGYTQDANMKKVVMIIAKQDFRDEELLEPKKVLEDNGIIVKIASTVLGEVKGVLGAQVKTDLLVRDIRVSDFDALVFVGGAGAAQYWDDLLAHKLVQDTLKDPNKILAAICIAPVTLAKAGVLKDRKATVWPSESEQLKSMGANYTGNDVEKDGNVITASGPSVAKRFGEEIVKALKK